ncbi:basic salivary proline-rich protein 3-like [Trichosurus vulpecula]|uniref:basic salivary proline-rich protein 3-like n=1 Tax=Trichosurus vulpecula TaxID=9337 RepID=UPI00186B3447|nr:basic salivary proline-rich protein 3-like [Trichosurus vulpecula]
MLPCPPNLQPLRTLSLLSTSSFPPPPGRSGASSPGRSPGPRVGDPRGAEESLFPGPGRGEAGGVGEESAWESPAPLSGSGERASRAPSLQAGRPLEPKPELWGPLGPQGPAGPAPLQASDVTARHADWLPAPSVRILPSGPPPPPLSYKVPSAGGGGGKGAPRPPPARGYRDPCPPSPSPPGNPRAPQTSPDPPGADPLRPRGVPAGCLDL